MTSIKLPVKVVEFPTHSEVQDSVGNLICSVLWAEQARQIALALNCHGALVEALEWYDEKEYASGINGETARAALAKVEDLRKTQTKP